MTYFEMLGVSVDSTDEEVKNKYRKKLMKFHPDSNIDADAGDKAFYEMMTRSITEAYEALKTAEKRKAYEMELRYGSNPNKDTTHHRGTSSDQGKRTKSDIGKLKSLYSYIEGRANSNSIVQGISGVAGFPWNLMMDAGTIFTHYVPLVNSIRDYFGYERFEKDIIQALITSIIEDLMVDVIGDKVLGSIPLIGMYFNYRCAKIMTWRIGILFTFVNVQGPAYNEAILRETAKIVRDNFPSEILASNGPEKQKRFIHIAQYLGAK